MELWSTHSKCPYCGKVISRGKYICDWCGHRRDDRDAGFFPYPFIFKPPGGGGSFTKRKLSISVSKNIP